MFSGIIERLGTVRHLAATPTERFLTLDTGLPDLTLGESVAVNGVCLTVTRCTPQGEADFHVSGETLARTALSRLAEGSRVNLERAITPATRLSGHIVQGHVDAVGHLLHIEPSGQSFHLQVAVPAALRRYVVEKGSIALDGISLTVNALGPLEETFPIHLMIIPHTWTHTTLGHLPLGAPLNIEVDVLAKYVETLLTHGQTERAGS